MGVEPRDVEKSSGKYHGPLDAHGPLIASVGTRPAGGEVDSQSLYLPALLLGVVICAERATGVRRRDGAARLGVCVFRPLHGRRVGRHGPVR